MDVNRIWQAALGELQLELTRATFETWLRNSRLVACEDGVFVIGVANSYARDWLESRLRAVVTRVLTRLTGPDRLCTVCRLGRATGGAGSGSHAPLAGRKDCWVPGEGTPQSMP